MLARKFNWQDFDSVYQKVDESRDVEPAGGGKYRFVALRTDGKKFVGVGFESTVAAMCDYEQWKLMQRETAKGKKVADVVEVIQTKIFKAGGK